MDSEKMDGLSMDIEAAEREKLQSVFPQCFTEGRLDIDKLLNLCGEYITDDFEKYEFKWKGKSECLQLAGKRSTGTLRPCPEESVDWENTRNLYIEGDNLEVLKLLQTSYYRKVKMIYIDPPYNTGNDFVYADDFADPLARYREVTQQTTKSNPETMGRFHTNWLNMMYPRLRLAANLLRDDGVIFISIDDNEVHNLRKLCDEVFGEEYHLATFIWHRRQMADSRNQTRASTDHEYVLAYTRSETVLHGKEIDTEKYSNPDNDPRGDWFSADLTGLANIEQRPNLHYDVINPQTGLSYPPNPTRGWSCSRETMQRLIEENRILWPKKPDGRPRQKKFLANVDNLSTSFSSMLDVGYTTEGTRILQDLFEEKLFSYPKPVSLIQTLIEQGSNNDDIILDFFAGSSTTAQAIFQQNIKDKANRQFVLVQLPELTGNAKYPTICEIGKERIRRAGAKIKSEQDGQVKLGETEKAPLDTGFRVFQLDSSNLKIWDDSPLIGENAATLFEQRMLDYLDVLVPGRTAVEVVYEVMLKLGQDLCEPILSIDLPNGRQVYGVGADVKFIVCLAPGITPEDANAMADYAPGRIIFAEQCFENTEQKSNVRLTLKDLGISIKTL